MIFFFNDTATTEIYTLSLHDALPISRLNANGSLDTSFNGTGTAIISFAGGSDIANDVAVQADGKIIVADPKSTRLNSSHQIKSYAVFFFKKKIHTTTSTFDRALSSSC